MTGLTTVDDLGTVDGLKAALVRARERDDSEWAASRYEPGARLLPKGAAVCDSGTYPVVLPRQDDGSWRSATGTWNSDSG